jgi:phospholipid/cholesterol/gamma-HCH transport system permease protein
MDIELISPGDWLKQQVKSVQDYTLIATRSVTNVFTRPRYLADTTQQADLIGWGSLPIVALTGFFTGAALAQNSGSTLQRFGSVTLIGQLVSLGMVRELGPVITGLMVAGRNAAGMASELGSMVVTEQIDAMRALGVDPMRKLVTPRLFATVSMLFFLTIISDAFGIFGGAVVTIYMNGQNGTQYFHQAYEFLHARDIMQGLVKPLFSGFIIATIGCFYGLRTTGGTEGVGRSTIQAVVSASVLIIFVDLLISQVMVALFNQ